MRQISSKKFIICLVSLLLIVTCTSCKAKNKYLIKEYLNYLSNKSGINYSDNIEDNFQPLIEWKIIKYSDKNLINEELDYNYLSKTICRLLNESGNPMAVLKNRGWITDRIKEKNKIDKITAERIVDEAVYIINNRVFNESTDYQYRSDIKSINDKEVTNGDLIYDADNNKYLKVIDAWNKVYEDASFEDVYSYLDISNTYEVDFSDAEIIPLNDENEDSVYINNKYTLLADKSHVFNKDGFRVSYKINSSGIDVHVSKKEDKSTIYFDSSIKSIKPSFKWTYDKGDIRNCYFNLTFNSTTTLGVTIGKYGDYYIKFKDLDNSSFISKLKSMVVDKADEVEAIIPICEVKTPIPNIPIAKLDMIIGIKLYVSGKAEIVMLNKHNVGFEVVNGKARFFYDHTDDLDAIVRASSKAALALNVGLEAASFKLCDVELDGGIKGELKSTIHLYDKDNNVSVIDSDYAYSTLDEISKENEKVKICGDLSLYWMLDLICNTSKTQMSKMGFSKTFSFLDENNQVFNNLHHIENGQFVEKCTRKNKGKIKNIKIDVKSSNKIVLNTYAEVLQIDETIPIELISLPSGYNKDDIILYSNDDSVANVDNQIIKAHKPGSCKITVQTNDQKYSSYISVLVSTG